MIHVFKTLAAASAVVALVAGSALTAGRLLRCHPWCDGGIDPVPGQLPGLFSRLGLGAPPHPDDPGLLPARHDSREPAP